MCQKWWEKTGFCLYLTLFFPGVLLLGNPSFTPAAIHPKSQALYAVSSWMLTGPITMAEHKPCQVLITSLDPEPLRRIRSPHSQHIAGQQLSLALLTASVGKRKLSRSAERSRNWVGMVGCSCHGYILLPLELKPIFFQNLSSKWGSLFKVY